jgi:hypothetical protein
MTSNLTIASPRKRSFVLTTNKDQGKFHLLTILVIPGFLVTVFLAQKWYWILLYLLIAVSILFLVFRKK